MGGAGRDGGFVDKRVYKQDDIPARRLLIRNIPCSIDIYGFVAIMQRYGKSILHDFQWDNKLSEKTVLGSVLYATTIDAEDAARRINMVTVDGLRLLATPYTTDAHMRVHI